MERKQIATVKLAPGQGNFFDELTRIHLTMGNPNGAVYAGMNVSNIRKAIRSGRLVIVNGSLGPAEEPFKLVAKNGKYVLERSLKKKAEVKKAEPKKEEPKPAPVEEAPIEEEAPVVEEAPAVEEAPVEEKKTKKSKKSKKAE